MYLFLHIFIENLGDGLEILRRERGESVFLRLHDGRDQLFAERSARFGEPYDLVVARAGNGFQISEFFQAQMRDDAIDGLFGQ